VIALRVGREQRRRIRHAGDAADGVNRHRKRRAVRNVTRRAGELPTGLTTPAPSLSPVAGAIAVFSADERPRTHCGATRIVGSDIVEMWSHDDASGGKADP
jgi:hypothetical protein